MRAPAAILSLLLALPFGASAHHSLAEYDRSAAEEVEGEVVRVLWRNPHVRFTLRTKNEAGREEVWDLQGVDLNSLDRRDVPHDLVQVGDTIRVTGNPSNRRAHHLLMSNVLTANGTEILIEPTAEPLWSAAVVGRLVASVEPSDVGGGGRSIFRVWSTGAAARGWGTRHFPFTEAAVAARAAWDPDDNFATRCEPEGMPRIMTNPHPFEFVDRGATIELRSEFYDLTRIIHMDGAADPAEQPPGPLGYSVGRWEGDTLIVTTSRVNWPYFDTMGTPQSEAVTYEERFQLSEEPRRLDYRLTINDSATFTEPAFYERYWLALGEELQRYDCQVF